MAILEYLARSYPVPIKAPDSEVYQAKQCLAVRRVSMRIEAMSAHEVDEAMDFSQSLASRRHRPSQTPVLGRAAQWLLCVAEGSAEPAGA